MDAHRNGSAVLSLPKIVLYPLAVYEYLMVLINYHIWKISRKVFYLYEIYYKIKVFSLNYQVIDSIIRCLLSVIQYKKNLHSPVKKLESSCTIEKCKNNGDIQNNSK